MIIRYSNVSFVRRIKLPGPVSAFSAVSSVTDHPTSTVEAFRVVDYGRDDLVLRDKRGMYPDVEMPWVTTVSHADRAEVTAAPGGYDEETADTPPKRRGRPPKAKAAE